MAAMILEEESGTQSGRVHPHNGYYAGDFRTTAPLPAAWNAPIAPFDPWAGN